ncbi:nicotinate (nicotinamide) nucleotide adenylyltransferase [Thermophagus xiamenensis]|uniref:Probable nicotinate-nucleotide adenylyltransferase n=1 Tax=Thermophagus xiamenensis TaxID=385682 RepID=A0A1I2BK66_9BACT|nr:nicotinate (nicotinamide) nucleotide adenylyltransferase [Thermophagus xiamenensis]SFE56409.1 nicotinate-nucleotide adenylyltransferase [Thermophagus xiamenensis]
MQKTGLLFGSFNPIHIGHLALANYVLEYAPFDEIWFVVSPQNPFKTTEELATSHHRLTMTNMAVGSESRFKVCDIEFSMPVPSYTINTLQKLTDIYPNNDFSLIIGSDNWHHINQWHNSEQLLQHHSIVIYPRPGFPIEVNNTYNLSNNVKFLEAPLLDISSTLIRKGLKEGKNLKFLLPHGIYDYIISNHLYNTMRGR